MTMTSDSTYLKMLVFALLAVFVISIAGNAVDAAIHMDNEGGGVGGVGGDDTQSQKADDWLSTMLDDLEAELEAEAEQEAGDNGGNGGDDEPQGGGGGGGGGDGGDEPLEPGFMGDDEETEARHYLEDQFNERYGGGGSDALGGALGVPGWLKWFGDLLSGIPPWSYSSERSPTNTNFAAAFGSIGSALYSHTGQMADWQNDVHQVMCQKLYISGIECWANALCHLSSKIEGDDTVTSYFSGGAVYPAAHLQVERSQPIVSPNGTEYIYTVSYLVTFPQDNDGIDEDMEYSLTFSGSVQVTAISNAEVEEGDSAGTGQSPIVKYSSNLFTSACLHFNPSIRTYDGGEEDKICVGVTEYTGEAQTMEGAGGTSGDSGDDGGGGGGESWSGFT